jgi:hypothetical protein
MNTVTTTDIRQLFLLKKAGKRTPCFTCLFHNLPSYQNQLKYFLVIVQQDNAQEQKKAIPRLKKRTVLQSGILNGSKGIIIT